MGEEVHGRGRGRAEEKRHRIDCVCRGTAGRRNGKEKGSEKGRTREYVGDEKKESWIIEGETPKEVRRKRGDLAEVKQTLNGYVGEVRDGLSATRRYRGTLSVVIVADSCGRTLFS